MIGRRCSGNFVGTSLPFHCNILIFFIFITSYKQGFELGVKDEGLKLDGVEMVNVAEVRK